ncbi:hypothetical protein DFH07DRAFT_829190 [Mycena maculata]|uniref:F-box domain-containing protein n=1 Tax=Mycena maculata TaxID=230809 RepID=A0AAD7IUC9_9AGAR|nr:hypothetical protein DFH07DRAFT_829190 [Mycena maculata]
MRFQDLPEDNLRSIFTFCDIYTVLALGRANTYLRRLTRERLVWADLVKNLRRKGFIDQSFSEIQSLSQQALVTLVKGLLTGPTSWKPKPSFMTSKLPFLARFISKSSLRPHSRDKTLRQFIVHPPRTSAVTFNRKEAKLLGGGEYVLFNNQTGIEQMRRTQHTTSAAHAIHVRHTTIICGTPLADAAHRVRHLHTSSAHCHLTLGTFDASRRKAMKAPYRQLLKM